GARQIRLARVADEEHGAAGDRHLGGATDLLVARATLGGAWCVQLRDEFRGRGLREDLRLRAVAAEKAGQALLRLQRVDQPRTIVLLRQTFLVGRAQEEPAQPLGEITADEQEVALLQLAQERIDLAAVRNQVVRVLE